MNIKDKPSTTKVVAGTQLEVEGDTFEVVEFLGRGGYATAHSARRVVADKEDMVAIKVINLTRFKSTHKVVEYTHREVTLMSALRHPNILKLRHHFQVDHLFYLVLELCPNKTLGHLIKDKNIVLHLEHIKDLVHQLASGGEYMHSQLVLHRDIKPDNVLLDADYVLKIADFGLAVQLSSPGQRVQSFCGTPKYQAPELILGRGYGLGVDAWAAGCTIYRLYYGHAPFEAVELKELQHAIVHRNVKYSWVTQHDIPVKNEDIQVLKTLLCKDPAKRLTFMQLLVKKKYFQGARPLTTTTTTATTTMINNPSNFAGDEVGRLKSMINTLKRLTQTCKANKRLRVDYLNEHCESLKPAHWIVQWATGGRFFGQGYRTNTNIFGCNFKDASKMLLLDDKIMLFWAPNKAIELHVRGECPEKLKAKLSIITKLKMKTEDNANANKTNIDKTTEKLAAMESFQKLPWLIGHVETEKAYVFHLSNALFQVLLPEKIVLFDGDHRSMTIINSRKQVRLTLSLDYIEGQKYITELLHNYIYVPFCYIKMLAK